MKPQITKWKYMLAPIAIGRKLEAKESIRNLVLFLNKKGDEGWECYMHERTGSDDNNYYYQYAFRQPIISNIVKLSHHN